MRRHGYRGVSFAKLMKAVEEVMKPVIMKLENGENPTRDEWERYMFGNLPMTGEMYEKLFERFFPKNGE